MSLSNILVWIRKSTHVSTGYGSPFRKSILNSSLVTHTLIYSPYSQVFTRLSRPVISFIIGPYVILIHMYCNMLCIALQMGIRLVLISCSLNIIQIIYSIYLSCWQGMEGVVRYFCMTRTYTL